MNIPFLFGIIGGCIVVLGAAWPLEKVSHPTQSIKNWLFAIGSFFLLIYSILEYLNNGGIFFVLLQILVQISTILMMTKTSDRLDSIVLGTTGTGLVLYSLTLFEGYGTLFFVLGLMGIGMGYAANQNVFRRNLFLTVGSIMVAIFSYLEASWVFFWLNVFFALFSAYHLRQILKKR